MSSLAVLTIAGLMAGGLNAAAVGGTFLSFSALVWLGVPPIMANATAILTALPGYIGGAWAYRHDIAAEGPLSLRAIILMTFIGGLLGAGLLLVTRGETFVRIVPWLLLVATGLFAAAPRPLTAAATSGRGFTGPATSAAALFLVAVYGGYGGYFNGGLGIVLLAVLGVIGFTNIHGMNGLKNLLSAILSMASVIAYAAAGLIAWDSALVLAVATMIGGYLGARWARCIQRTELLRAGIVAVGAVMTVVFFMVFFIV